MNIYDIADYSSCLFEAFCALVLFEAFLKRRDGINRAVYYAGAIVLSVLMSISNHILTTNLVNMSVVIGLELLFSVLYKGDLKKRVIASTLSMMIFITAETVVLISMTACIGYDVASVVGEGNLRIWGIIISKALGCIMSALTAYKAKKRKTDLDVDYWILFWFMFLSVIITVHTLSLVLMEGVERNISIQIYISAAGVIMTAIIILFMYEKNIRQRSELERERYQQRQLSDQIKYYSEMAVSYDRIKGLRHDLNNHLLAIKAKIENDEIDECISYIDGIIGKTVGGISLYETGNTVLDSLLSAKRSEAENKNIRFMSKINIPSLLPINEEDICIIFGNVLDNAIEACERISGGRYISFLLAYDGKDLTLRVENSCSSETSVDYGTSKGDKENHGIGRHSIEQILDKYNAVYYTEVQDRVYIFSAVFADLKYNSVNNNQNQTFSIK